MYVRALQVQKARWDMGVNATAPEGRSRKLCTNNRTKAGILSSVEVQCVYLLLRVQEVRNLKDWSNLGAVAGLADLQSSAGLWQSWKSPLYFVLLPFWVTYPWIIFIGHVAWNTTVYYAINLPRSYVQLCGTG